MIWSALTLAVMAGAGLQNGAQLVPSHTARKSALGLPPAFVKVPPTKSLTCAASQAIACTSPLSGDGVAYALQKLVGYHTARCAAGLPSAVVKLKLPPTSRPLSDSVLMAYTAPFSEATFGVLKSPRLSQPPGPPADTPAKAKTSAADPTRTRIARFTVRAPSVELR